jgi:uncharacterized tellurite resistance protein B-like protein
LLVAIGFQPAFGTRPGADSAAAGRRVPPPSLPSPARWRYHRIPDGNQSMTDHEMSPLFALAVALAYMIQSDATASTQEKAEFLTVFGKLLISEEMSKAQVERLTRESFDYAGKTPLPAFIKKITPKLSVAQKMAMLVNLYDAMLVDGTVNEAERSVFRDFQHAFLVNEKTVKIIREVLMLRNDISLFTNPSHPFNNDDFDLIHLLGGR